MYRICLVEDEKNLHNLVKSYLTKAGYEVISCFSGVEAQKQLTSKIDLWILDIMLGDNVSGYDLIKQIQENDPLIPVVFTSARDQELDKIMGLELGSDDYLTKPYSPKELLLRVDKIIKRVYQRDMHKMNYETYIVDTDKRVVWEQELMINLTTLEFNLLILFLENKNHSFTRELILETVWGDDYYGNDRVVDDLIRRLRKKMPALNINTVYGFGYRLS